MPSAKVFLSGAFLLVVIIVGLVWVRFRDCPEVFRRYYHTIFLRDKDFIAADVRFRESGAGAFVPPNGRLSGFTTFRASDCVDVIVEDEDEGSPTQAAEETEKRIRAAGVVIEELPVRHGKFIAQRAVLTPEGRAAEILTQYKDDRRLHVIRSSSLSHALAYEKLIQHGYELDRDGYVIDVTEPYRPGTR